jgi:GH25 family lysozyme M1 (1,4-beta-N-acetylmuramidase)
MLLGVDVWHGYGKIDWARAKAAGVRFAIAKCTQGNDSKDPRFDEYVAGAKAAGVPIGAYLFAYPLPSGPGKPAGRSPEEQASRFFTESSGLGKANGELPPALDLEWPARWDQRYKDANGNLVDRWKHWEVDAESIARWGLACLAEMERLWGRLPLLYTYPDFWRNLGPWGKLPEWKRYPLWMATYAPVGRKQWLPAAHEKPIIPAPWDDWAVWQFSADGSPVAVPGIPAVPLDRNVVKDEATLERLVTVDAPAASACCVDCKCSCKCVECHKCSAVKAALLELAERL